MILNSSDQISDSEERQGGNRLPAIIRQVDSIILKGIIADNTTVGGINFNPYQIEEEQSKLKWTANNSDKAELLYELEDNELLHGQISIVGLDHPEYFERFKSLFNCKWDLVDCALFTIGDYKQKERNGCLYQLGSSMNDSWKTLFHKSENLSGFENTKKVLNELLSRNSNFTNEYLEGLIYDYLEECEGKREYSWIYYYVKYEVFRTKRYGKYKWDDFEEQPYVFTTIFQRKKPSENSYNPFLKAVDNNVWRDWNGRYIRINDKRLLTEKQSSYQIVSNDDNEDLITDFPISQNANGIDTENRIEKMKRIFKTLNTDLIDNGA